MSEFAGETLEGLCMCREQKEARGARRVLRKHLTLGRCLQLSISTHLSISAHHREYVEELSQNSDQW
jgi:hypothetical protein